MKKSEIVKTHQEFNEIIQKGKKEKNAFYNIYIRKSNLKISRFGIAVGKKLGNAVFRNKKKRQLRNILTNQRNIFQNGYDYIIIMKEKTKEATYQELESNLLSIFQKGEKK